MNHHITDVSTQAGFVVTLRFSDGFQGFVDLESWFAGRGGLFTALQSPEYFRRVKIDPESHTLVWPNGVDLDPIMLYEAARAPAHKGG